MGASPKVYAVLLLGVVAVSWAAIFVRLANAPALSIAAYRLLFAAVPVGLFALVYRRDTLRPLPAAGWQLLLLSGVALALHFATWIGSLQLTSVTSSVALVTTQPLWAALIAAVVLKEPVSKRTAVAIGIATAGGALIGLRDLAAGGEALLGDALALIGALCAAVYFAIGRRVRSGLDLSAYVGVVYPVAAAVLVVVAVGGRQPLSGFSTQTWAIFLLLALVPQLIGHSSLNWALRYLPVHLVAVAILGEPVLSSLLAIPFLDERPGGLRVLGGLITLVGVYLALREGTRQPTPTVTAAGVESSL